MEVVRLHRTMRLPLDLPDGLIDARDALTCCEGRQRQAIERLLSLTSNELGKLRQGQGPWLIPREQAGRIACAGIVLKEDNNGSTWWYTLQALPTSHELQRGLSGQDFGPRDVHFFLPVKLGDFDLSGVPILSTRLAQERWRRESLAAMSEMGGLEDEYEDEGLDEARLLAEEEERYRTGNLNDNERAAEEWWATLSPEQQAQLEQEPQGPEGEDASLLIALAGGSILPGTKELWPEEDK